MAGGKQAKDVATVTRIPRMHGRPDMTRGSTVILWSISLFIIFQLCILGVKFQHGFAPSGIMLQTS